MEKSKGKRENAGGVRDEAGLRGDECREGIDLTTIVMKVESGTLTGIIDALVRKGWVTRREHPNDRRVKLLALSEESRIRWANVPNPIHVLRPVMMRGFAVMMKVS